MTKLHQHFLTALCSLLLFGCTSPYLEIFPELPNSALMDKKIAPDLLKADIQSFYQGALERHPSMDKYANQDELVKTVKLLQEQVNQPMTRLEFYKIVGQLTHKFGDGHSMLIWPYQEYERFKSSGGISFPFPVKITPSGDIFLQHSYKSENGSLAAGSKINSINRLNANELLASMQKYVGGESEYLRQQFVANRFGLTLWAVFGFADQFELETEFDGETKTLLIDKGDKWSKLDQISEQDKDFYFKELAADTGYLYIGHFDVDIDWFENFVDEAFVKIKKKNISSLIIDIRKNTGGNTDTATYLLSYLASKQFQLVSKVTEKLNNDNRGLFNYKGSVGELIENNWDDWEDPIDNEYLFKGNSYLLISPITYSAGIVFATAAKDNDMAILIGQQTGGNANQTAQGNLFNLPNSKLRAYITTRMLVRPSGSNAAGGVKPHYETTPTQSSIASERDVELEKALSLIHSSQK